MRGETRRKARGCIHRRSIAARIAAKTTGAATQGAGERPRPRAPRRTPEGAKRGFVSGRSRAEPFLARRIRQDRGPTAYMYTPSGRVDGETARPERRARLPETKPHVDRQTTPAQNRNRVRQGQARSARKVWGPSESPVFQTRRPRSRFRRATPGRIHWRRAAGPRRCAPRPPSRRGGSPRGDAARSRPG